MTWTTIIIAIFVLFTIWQLTKVKEIEKTEAAFNEALKTEGIDLSTKVWLGNYVGGHPEIDNSLTHVFSFKSKNNLKLYAKMYKNSADISTVYFSHLADIPIEKITNISIEDTSTIDKKVTLGRVLLVGVFALAWKKEKINKQAFLNIIWNDGKYMHETLFRFKDLGAFQEANKIRNNLIRQTK